MFTRKVTEVDADGSAEDEASAGSCRSPRKAALTAVAASAIAVAGLGLLAACGSSGGGTTNTAGSDPSSSSAASGYAAYAACLKQNGVTLPTGRPSGRPSGGYGGGGGGGGYGGGGGGGFFGGGTPNPQMSAAEAACASDRPTGGAGFGQGGSGFGGGGTRLAAFRSCMTQQGEAIPTTRPTSFPTATGTAAADARYLDGLDPSDPGVAKALAVCQPLIPTGAPTPPAGN